MSAWFPFVFGGVMCACGLVVMYVHPVTRPLVQRYWWLAVIPVLVVAAVVAGVMIGAKRSKVGRSKDTAKGVITSIDALVEGGKGQLAIVDAEFARRRLETRAIDRDGAARLVEFDEGVRDALRITNPAARRAALVSLVEGVES